ncbi:hypothetical protein KA005_42325 [bacterium]|nr:hypothetical protein [bacterium]
MPTYILECPECGKEETVICMVKERNSITCKCGGRMKVKITTANFRMRHGKPDVIEWKKQRGVLDL